MLRQHTDSGTRQSSCSWSVAWEVALRATVYEKVKPRVLGCSLALLCYGLLRSYIQCSC